MFGRKDYTPEELGRAKAAVAEQLAGFQALTNAAGSKDKKVTAALEGFEPLFFNNMTIVLDRYFVHRLRMVTGKDTNPLNEVELIADSVMTNDAILRGNNVIKYKPEQSVTKLAVGDRIQLSHADFDRLAEAFFAELEKKFL
jgi:hypothetical protein